MANVVLKLVGASRYVSAATNNDVVEKGGTVTVSEEHAAIMLEETKRDALNNEHNLWVKVGASEGKDASKESAEGEEAAEEAEQAKPTRVARSKTK